MEKREAEERFEYLKDLIFPKWDGESTYLSLKRKRSYKRGQINPSNTFYPYPMCLYDEGKAKEQGRSGLKHQYFNSLGKGRYGGYAWYREPSAWGNDIAKYTDMLIRAIHSNKELQEILDIDLDVFEPEYKWNTETIKKDLFNEILGSYPWEDHKDCYEYSHHNIIDFESVCNRLISVLSLPPSNKRENQKIDYFGIEELEYCEVQKMNILSTDRIDEKATEEHFQDEWKNYKSFGRNVIPYMGGRLYHIFNIACSPDGKLREILYRERTEDKAEALVKLSKSYIHYLFEDLMPRYWKKLYVAYKTGRLDNMDFSDFIRFRVNGSCEYKLQDGFIKVLYKMLLHMEEAYCLENKEPFSEKSKSREILSCLDWVYNPKDLENKAGALFQPGNRHKGKREIWYVNGVHGTPNIEAVPVGIIRNKRKWLLLEPNALFMLIPVKNNRGSYYKIIKQTGKAYTSSLKGDKISLAEINSVELDLLLTESIEL